MKMSTELQINIFGEPGKCIQLTRHTGTSSFIGKLVKSPVCNTKVIAVRDGDGTYHLIPGDGRRCDPLSKKIIQTGEIFKLV